MSFCVFSGTEATLACSMDFVLDWAYLVIMAAGGVVVGGVYTTINFILTGLEADGRIGSGQVTQVKGFWSHFRPEMLATDSSASACSAFYFAFLYFATETRFYEEMTG